MSDAEVSDVSGDEAIVRQHEDAEDDDDGMQGGDVNVSGDDEVKADEDNQDDAKKVEPPKKKRSTHKMIVLNTERLKGPKGVHTVEKLFQGFKYRGKGHEKEDLDRVMKRLEYYCFRLFPKLDFDDILSKCEHLGHKKDMQVFLKKYRLGMISPDDVMAQNDTIVEEEEKEDDPVIARTESALQAEIQNDDFQRLFDEVDLQAVEQQAQEQTS